MSLEDKAEDEAYAAVNAVCKMLRAHERERILKAIVTGIMVFMKWETITINRKEFADEK